jgi:aerobic-type carbon monoxide dehydrogenase small subunit (CoxS/CutS family)
MRRRGCRSSGPDRAATKAVKRVDRARTGPSRGADRTESGNGGIALEAVLELRVNGEKQKLVVQLHHTLLEVLRENLGLTGTKHGCEVGECGTCTVLVDGVPTLSCLTLPSEVEGREITTVEGLAQGGTPHPLQEAFAELGAGQCGYCTPGMLMSARALLEANPSPSRDEIREGLAGNLCRCTGYLKIFEAVELASRRAQEASRRG